MALQMFELTIFQNGAEVARRTDILRVAPMKYIYTNSATLVLTNSRYNSISDRITLQSIDPQLNGALITTNIVASGNT